MAVFLPLILFAQAVLGATQWYAQYNLTDSHIESLKQRGCFRGLFGGVVQNGDPRTLALVTCPPSDSMQKPFAVTDDDAFLCVVELTFGVSLDSAQLVAEKLGAKVLFRGVQELVLANPHKQSELHDACCVDHFPQLADNVLYVAQEPIKPLQPLPHTHPAVQKFVLGLEEVAPNPLVQTLVDSINQDSIKSYDTSLSTDYDGTTGTNSKITRNSYSIPSSCTAGWKCANDAVDYVVRTVTALFGSRSDFSVTTSSFRSDMCSNVIAEIRGTVYPDQIVVVGAHLDSRMAVNTDTRRPAPGADDNGSGSAVNLEIARVIATTGIKFENTIQLMWFCGEEQGLLGSAAIAKSYASTGKNVLGMFNTDMIGYLPSGGVITMAFMTGSASKTFTDSCKNIVAVYLPTLKTGSTSACCSDQQSFNNNGFPALGIFETATTSVVYPDYHRETDTLDKVSFDQVFAFAQGMVSCIGEYAVPKST